MNDKWEDYTEYCDELKQQNRDLVAALEATQKLLDDLYAENIISSGDLGMVYEKNKQALAPYEECSCLPDLPDGRGRGHCPVCEADSQREEIPFGGE